MKIKLATHCVFAPSARLYTYAGCKSDEPFSQNLDAAASCYDPAHPRNNSGTGSTCFLFQPFHSFARKRDETGLIPEQAKQWIREKFSRAGMPYNVNLATSEFSAFKIVKPLHINDDLVRWWEFPPKLAIG